ncbi:hypothetical protein [Ornithinibacillus halotolerans]|uniref:Uncharacterized protein n=1 Tax=Ornithinibacillus halotolerans TaxID=1274357 RepID=A0A916W7A2_9BACI|nr:hypothetical protein [Ornithinibacillus halotolerans]GGA72620.1 hypothetical protein GCM10008025_15520 [Ornithinibacillus halotolerans]
MKNLYLVLVLVLSMFLTACTDTSESEVSKDNITGEQQTKDEDKVISWPTEE